MVINIPVIADVDILISGASTAAVRGAVELAERGHSVYLVTPENFCGGEIGSTLDFYSAAHDRELFPEFPVSMPRPMEVKRILERKLVRAGIPFLYRTFPVRRIEDEKGCFAGMVIACRSGFAAIRAKVMLDGSMRRWSSVVAGAPERIFIPGNYNVERILIGAPPSEGSGIKFVRMDPGFTFAEENHPVFKASCVMHFENGRWPELCRAECEMRQKCWSPEQVFAVDSCIFDLPPALISGFRPTPEFPFVSDVPEAVKMLKQCMPGRKIHIPGKDSSSEYAAVHFDNWARFRKCEKVPFRLSSIPAGDRYDVLVAGGGTGGAPAAVGAARSSAKVLCLEAASHLGGLGTQGRIAAYWFGNRRGYSCELDKNVAEMGPNGQFPAEGNRWNIEWKQHHFLRAFERGGVNVWFKTIAAGALRRGNIVTGVIAASPDGCRLIFGTAVIDATGNADVAAAAGASCEYASASEPALQGCGVSRSNPGVHLANCDYCFISESDTVDTTSAWVRGREKYSSEFDIAPVLGSRERRRIVGDIQLKPEDFLLGRCYSDTIVEAISNFDTHGFVIHGLFMLAPADEEPLTAKVPYRTLLPADLDGILVTGLGVSAHRDAMPVIRMQADVQNQGFAAGLAAGMTSIRNRTVRRVDIQELQRMLCSIGNLSPEILLENDGFDPEAAVPEFAEFAAFFQDPEKNAAEVIGKMKSSGDLRLAALLAFAGNDAGRKLLVAHINDAEWDEGWNFRGMGQFGASVSQLDAELIALAGIADGSEKNAVLKLLGKLKPDMAFSHFRAMGVFLCKNPDPDAVPFLKDLLKAPGISGSVESSLVQIIERTTPDPNENMQRTCQLKELYLLKALQSCDPACESAAVRLAECEEGPVWLYASFAGR
ncbi:MAG: FAD-dependent oxidoreductase [Lentisphaeria bacterium]|nr:FAD-dependent oxidoreductase [Lentisphaeria bacterium]